MQTMIHVFLTSFVDIGKGEVTEPVRSIHDEKSLVFIRPLSLEPSERSRQKVYKVIVFFPFLSLCHVSSYSIQFPKIDTQKCVPD